MLAEHKLNNLLDLVSKSSKEELAWMNGYIAGLLAGSHATIKEDQSLVSAKPKVNKLTIAYATETGNSKKIALEFVAKAKKKGIASKLVSLDQYRLNDLGKEEYFLTIISTHGEGEPPDAAKKFYNHIHNNGFKLDNLKYSVLALGDTSYPLFCKAGEDVDTQLQKLGGQRIMAMQKCDLDFDEEANKWFLNVLEKLDTTAMPAVTVAPPVIEKKSTGKKIYTASVLANINLNDIASEKETYHIEVAADNVEYEAGDSMGIVPENSGKVVDEILALTNIDGNKNIVYKTDTWTVSELLRKKVSVIHLLTSVVKKYATIVSQEIPETKMDLLDLLKIYPVKNEFQFEEVLGILTPVAPRIYTIASSPSAHAGEVHLTVAKDVYRVNQELKIGLCSAFLKNKNDDSTFSFFVQKNKRFRLPAADKDIVMIGPETGIAAFRSFLYERDATGATGKNWLFFGEKNFTTDFLYQTEIQNWFEAGLLTKVNVAFEDDNFLVQDKMLKNGKELYEWISSGAYVYVCGIKDPMSIEVEKMLLSVIEKFGGKTNQESLDFFEQLKKEGRYSKDVY